MAKTKKPREESAWDILEKEGLNEREGETISEKAERAQRKIMRSAEIHASDSPDRESSAMQSLVPIIDTGVRVREGGKKGSEIKAKDDPDPDRFERWQRLYGEKYSNHTKRRAAAFIAKEEKKSGRYHSKESIRKHLIDLKK